MSNSQQLDGNGNPIGQRQDGWYWVRKIQLGRPVGHWEPAKWVAEARCWYSIEWFGRPDSMVECGERIERRS